MLANPYAAISRRDCAAAALSQVVYQVMAGAIGSMQHHVHISADTGTLTQPLQ